MAPSVLLLEFIQKRDDLNTFARKLAGMPVYGAVEMPAPKLQDVEVGFLRTVPWLFVHHHEAGAVSIRFLVGLFDGYGVDGCGHAREHPNNVVALRTELQHNLLSQSSADVRTQNQCGEWYLRACGTRVPSMTAHWEACLRQLLGEAVGFLDCLDQCIRHLESDEAAETQIEIWRRRFDRDHQPHEYDEVIRKVAGDIGRDELDVVAFRNRHLDRWRAEVRALADGYDFQWEARRLVEASLVSEMIQRLPITGTDIMEVFGLPPGRRIGDLLQQARALYSSERCDRDTLLDRLRTYVEKTEP